MALPAHLQRFLNADPVERSAHDTAALAPLSTGLSELDALLPDGGLPRASVIELSCAGAALATSVSLSVCKVAQAEGTSRLGEPSWCAFVDPIGTLHSPFVAQSGVELDRLLVVRPPVEALSRVVIRLVESRAFSVVVVDTLGVPGAPLNIPLGGWPRTVRRLALALEGSDAIVMLITDSMARRPLPLPVGLRLELRQPRERQLELQVAKDKRGRLASPKTLAWTRARIVSSLASGTRRER
jgi:hypothetical protein